MKVLHLLTTNKMSGAEKVAIDIIHLCSKEIESVYCSPKGEISKVLAEENINYAPLNTFSYYNVKKIIDEINPDVIHAHDFKASLLSSFFYKDVNCIISHLHHVPDWYKKKNLKSLMYMYQSKKFKNIIGVTDSILIDTPYKSKIINSKFIILGNPINNKEIQRKSKLLTIEGYDLVFVGRLSPDKRPLLFLEIVKELKELNSSIKVCMIGEGPLQQDVDNYIQKNNMDQTVSLKGFISNPYPYIKNSKISISTSRREGFGLSIVESLILDTPVIAFNIDGLGRFIDNNTGVLVETKEEMVKAIVEMLEHPLILNSSKSKLNKYLDIDKYKYSILKIYGEIFK